MGSAVQAGGPVISRCRNRELNTAEPGTAEEGARVLAGSDPGMSPRSVRARPSSIMRNWGIRTTSTGERRLANVHAKSPEPLRALGQKAKARQETARTGCGHPLHGASVQLACN